METKKLRSLPQAAAALEPGWPQASGLQSLCASLSDAWRQERQAPGSLWSFPFLLRFLLPFRPEPWSAWDCILSLGVVCFLSSTAGTRSISRLVGTDFEMVSTPASPHHHKSALTLAE